MSRRSREKFIRFWHRRLAPIIGIQLLLWSLGGIYFSWVQVPTPRADSGTPPAGMVNLKYENYLAPIPPIVRNSQLAEVRTIALGKLLNIPVYRLIQDERQAELYNAITGEKLSPLGRTTAIDAAQEQVPGGLAVRQVERVEEPGGEYRGSIPAWRISFDRWDSPAIYVSAHTGEVTARGSVQRRAYDLLWMLHIMDYRGRADFSNWLIRIVSVLGLVTICAGYYLWYLTTPLLQPKGRKASSRK